MKTRSFCLIIACILSFVLQANKTTKSQWVQTFKNIQKKNPTLIKGNIPYPIMQETYTFDNNQWVLSGIDSIRFDNQGRLIEFKNLTTSIREQTTYDAYGNIIETVQSKGNTNIEKKVYAYDSILKNYRTLQIYYQWENNKWNESYKHFKKIERNGNNILSIRIFTVRESDTALHSSYYMGYDENGRAKTYCEIDNFEGINDTNVFYKNMVWETWNGQLTENDFLENNKLKSAVLTMIGEPEEGIDPEAFYSARFFENAYEYEFSLSGEDMITGIRSKHTTLDSNGSFVDEYTEFTFSSQDTNSFSSIYSEVYDEHKNIIGSTLKESEYPEEPMLTGKIDYINTYGEDGRFLGFTITEYNPESMKTDSMEKTIYIFADTETPPVTAVEKNTSDKIIRIFPNPAKDEICLYISPNDFDKFQIYDLSGRLLREEFYIPEQYNVSDLKSGMYILKLSNEKTNISQKLIISKK